MRQLVIALLFGILPLPALAEPWTRHVIDNSSRGADGVRLADANGDGRPDIVTGWEEGGLVRVYLNPGPAAVKGPWPAVTVGQAASPEDAVFCDLDADGALDVVSCCEGKTQSVFFHRAPRLKSKYQDAAAWQTVRVACTAQTRWMFAVPLELDRRPGPELIVGSKSAGAMVGLLACRADPWDTGAWTLRCLCEAGWIMSLLLWDMDGDADLDLLGKPWRSAPACSGWRARGPTAPGRPRTLPARAAKSTTSWSSWTWTPTATWTCSRARSAPTWG